MTPTKTAAILVRLADDWRHEEAQLCKQFGDVVLPQSMRARRIKDTEAIDAAVEMIGRLEAAEKSDAESLAMYRRARDERDALRAKVERMEQQEQARLVTPTAYRWRYRGAIKWQYGELTEEGARLAKEHNHEVQPLYAIPGAQPSYLPSDLAEAIIADMQSQYDSELITENDSCEALIRLDGAIAAVEDNFAAATEAKP